MAAAGCKFTAHSLMSFSTISFHAQIPRDEVGYFSTPALILFLRFPCLKTVFSSHSTYLRLK
jgi:hypothetical protein